MKNAPLTARYRPQSFAEVAGQQTIKAILSRAAAEDKVAPAYLFSGTRGVGKTTIARIFAKALNCRQAPAAEPCNQCDLCKAVTQGAAIDVVEIDGASNRGIDDVRRLKEVVGYAPMDGRYKVFIIDEAHMLSRDAFNALLKTLEEPPAGVTFIMATTEPHKFPATVISRCQHFVFKRLSEQELVAHLSHVLTAESMDFEPQAVRLIARRGAGSVRDSMSLLGQVLALGSDSLTQETTRTVLGLAGQETFMALLEAVRQGNTLELVQSLRLFLEQGLDIGFFLRELANYWRELFILRQAGEAGLVAVDIPEDEAALMLGLSQKFSLPHIHACWQMTLEGQRRVQSSLEPGLALELLLLNLAMLPQLMPLDAISSLARRAHVSPASSASPSSQRGEGAQADGGAGNTEKTANPSNPVNMGEIPRGEHLAAVNEGPLAAADLTDRFPADHGGGTANHEAVQVGVAAMAEDFSNVSSASGMSGASGLPSGPSGQSADSSEFSGGVGGAVSAPSEAVGMPAFSSAPPPVPPVKAVGGGDELLGGSVEETEPRNNQMSESASPPSSWAGEDSVTTRKGVPSASESTVEDGVNLHDSAVKRPFAASASHNDSPLPTGESEYWSCPPEYLGVPGKKAVPEKSPEDEREPFGESDSPNPADQGVSSVGNAPHGSHGSGSSAHTPSPVYGADIAYDDADEDDEDESLSETLGSATHRFLPVWDDVVARAQAREGLPWFGGLVQSISGSWDGDELVLKVDSDFIGTKIMEPDTRQQLESLLESMMGRVPAMRVNVVKEAAFDKESMKEAMYENPAFKELEEILSARIIDFGRIHK